MSRVARSSVRGRPREVAAPQPHRQLAGCILWLPSKAEMVGDYDSDLEEDRCNHPVVVLSPYAEDGKVVYLMITSLRGMDLEERFAYSQTLRVGYLPIRPCRAHPDNGMLLSLADDALELKKRSYVNTKKQHRIQFNSLRPYDYRGPEYILSRASYQALIEYANFSPPLPHPVSNAVPSVWQQGQSALISPPPLSVQQRGSYGEYVSVMRGSSPRPENPSLTWYSRPIQRWEAQLSEREPLVTASSYGYSHNTYGWTYGTQIGASYRVARPRERSNEEASCLCGKILLWIIVGWLLLLVISSTIGAFLSGMLSVVEVAISFVYYLDGAWARETPT